MPALSDFNYNREGIRRHPRSGVVTVSVGIAAGTSDKFGSAEALMDAADKALYKAKSSGRNRSVAA